MEIRFAKRGDGTGIMRLIQALAEYEKAPNEVVNTAQDLERHLFDEEVCHALVCEIDFEIPKGLIEDDNVILEGFGHADLSSKKRGNIIVKLQIERDEKFMRNIMINNDVKIDKRNLLVQVHI